jgi:hypothetical protein
LTWRGHETYSFANIDSLIAQCDLLQDSHAISSLSFGPFTVFRTAEIPSPQAPPSDMNVLGENFQDRELNASAGFLFYHYSTHIAPMVMPFQDRRNPWQSSYPLMARCGNSHGRRSLLHAMLAQAAGNLCHMGYQKEAMSTFALKHRILAITELRKELSFSNDFCIVMASILTLIMAEVSTRYA